MQMGLQDSKSSLIMPLQIRIRLSLKTQAEGVSTQLLLAYHASSQLPIAPLKSPKMTISHGRKQFSRSRLRRILRY
jgi:hypothetical protein